MGLIAWEGLGVPIYTYGLVVLVAVIMGALCAWVTLRLHGERTAPLLDLLVYGLPVALVFARLGFVLHNFSQYSSNLVDIFCVWHGGLSFYGGMLGFFLTVLGYSLVHGVSAWHWLDLLVPAFILSIVVYELGIFGMQLTMGTPLPADVPNDHTLMEYIEYRYRPMGFENMLYFQPIALYQAGLQLAAFVLVSLAACIDAHRGRRWPAGCLFLFGLGLVAAIRFGCGFFYLNAHPETLLPLGRLLSGGAVLAAIIFFVARWRSRPHFYY
ncbi:MAG: prolipoprotein diacylglyceryl transferase [Selenomonadaceae bacterium]|nr:prolipoprotein diacylglyceryl transferase [Selenomonadaceae bacterium]